MSESTIENNEVEDRKHPIQLRHIGPKQLSITTLRPVQPGTSLNGLLYDMPISGSGLLDNNEVQVTIGFETADQQEKDLGVEIKAEITGFFDVDPTRFDTGKIDNWTIYNAPFILYPYLREQVHNLTMRCGFNPLILPTMEVPVDKARVSSESKAPE